MPFIFFMGWMLRFGQNLGFRTTHPSCLSTHLSTVSSYFGHVQVWVKSGPANNANIEISQIWVKYGPENSKNETNLPTMFMRWQYVGIGFEKNNPIMVNSEGFLAEVFHPWVRWEGPGSGFENSSGAGGADGVWNQDTQIWPPWDWGRETRFSNGLAYNRSKLSVNKSQIGFVVINFSRSIFPYMWNNFMDGEKWDFGSGQMGAFSKPNSFCGFLNMGPGHFSKIWNFQNLMFQPFKKNSY